MQIRLLATMAGPGGVYPVGTVRDLPRADAYTLMEGGYAEQIGDDVETATNSGAETAGAVVHETASVPPAETRRAPARKR